MKNAVGFFCSTRVMIEFLFPRFTEVLSTPIPTHFSQETSLLRSVSSIFEKIVSALAACSPKENWYWQSMHGAIKHIHVCTCGNTHVKKMSDNSSMVIIEITNGHWVHLLQPSII